MVMMVTPYPPLTRFFTPSIAEPRPQGGLVAWREGVRVVISFTEFLAR